MVVVSLPVLSDLDLPITSHDYQELPKIHGVVAIGVCFINDAIDNIHAKRHAMGIPQQVKAHSSSELPFLLLIKSLKHKLELLPFGEHEAFLRLHASDQLDKAIETDWVLGATLCFNQELTKRLYVQGVAQGVENIAGMVQSKAVVLIQFEHIELLPHVLQESVAHKACPNAELLETHSLCAALLEIVRHHAVNDRLCTKSVPF
mmetsp:Transcript_35438/g.82841  ORF Transcript_35438/g.82841 Transcript_35438/m.82841 type:complete len:204 (-) Transcript_35438:570-1181(-)